MAFSTTKPFPATILDMFNRTAPIDMNADTFKAALFGNSITPSQAVASAATAYGAGVWASDHVSDASGWPAAGRALVAVSSALSGNTYKFDADDTVSANPNTTLAAVYGCLVYDDTVTTPVADQGLMFAAFGGPNPVTNGTFTLIWNGTHGLLDAPM